MIEFNISMANENEDIKIKVKGNHEKIMKMLIASMYDNEIVKDILYTTTINFNDFKKVLDNKLKP